MLISCLSVPAKISPSPFKRSASSRQKLSSSSSSSFKSLKQTKFEHLKDSLIRQLDNKNVDHAFSILDQMTQQGIRPDLLTYSVLLKSCIRSHNFNLGKIVHSRLSQSGLKLDPIVQNSLISLYSKCGDWEMANSIFQEMGDEKDLVSWSAMISCFASNNHERGAITMFFKMLESGFYPNEFCFSGVIQACSDKVHASVGEVIFGSVIKTGHLDAHLCIGCSLIDLFTKGCGDLVSARKVFDRMPERNVVTWTLMITRCTQYGCPGDAIDLFVGMVSCGLMADRFTLSSVISACAEVKSFELGQQLHSQAIRTGSDMDVCVGCSLVDMYAKCGTYGSLDDSRKVFSQMPSHNVMSWTAIITGYAQCGGRDMEAIKLFYEMLKEGQVSPNQYTYASVLKGCGNSCDAVIGEQLFGHVVKLGFASFDFVGNSAISMFSRSGRMVDARKVFDTLFEKNLVSYNTMVDGYAKNLSSEEAFSLFNRFESEGIEVNAFTFASLLSGAASIGAMHKGEQLHARLVKVGFESDQCIGTALISMYSRCGNIEAASHVFNEIEDRNVISWTSMITGYAKHGYAREALEMFREMVSAGIRPNEVTYVAVLSACSHVGLVEEGWEHFNSMYKEHKITPRMEHYACMVDLLGRSGHLEEAFDFIYSMPFKADALVWKTLLGACQVRGNIELGKLAAENILELEPHDPAAYILLSNLYASKGRWNEVVGIRKKMKERKLNKGAGCSWIEMANVVHTFYVGDTSHPRAQEIFAKLDQLVPKIKELGYVPNTDFVLHDIDDELKEQYLLHHSEKIALAFGLISMSDSRPIRIFKNLRVCGDCHNAMKYISIATEREIVVRDSNRFHHIKDGICSCNEYW